MNNYNDFDYSGINTSNLEFFNLLKKGAGSKQYEKEAKDILSNVYKSVDLGESKEIKNTFSDEESMNSAIQLKYPIGVKNNYSCLSSIKDRRDKETSFHKFERSFSEVSRLRGENKEVIDLVPLPKPVLKDRNRRKSDKILPEIIAKTKIYQERRRKSQNKHRESGKRYSEMNPNLIATFVKKSEEGSVYGKYKSYIKWSDVLLACLVTANIVVSLIDNEINYSEDTLYIQKKLKENNNVLDAEVFKYMGTRVISVRENSLRFINIILVGCIVVVIYLHYLMKVKMLRVDQKLSESEGLWKAGLAKQLIIELVICAIIYPPYLNYVFYGVMLGFNFCYSMNSLVCIVVTLKSYVILRVYTYFSRWTTDTGKSLCLKHHVVPGVHFAIKAELKKRPYTMLIILSVVLVILFSLAMRTFEYYVFKSGANSVADNKLHILTNSIWLIIITMMTVGYGDVYPKSHFGRFVGVISCVIGLLLVSLIVVSLAIVSDFQIEEKKAYSILKKLKAHDNATNKALDVIKTFLKLRNMLIEKKSFKLSQRFVVITQLKKGISKFKNGYKIANSHNLPTDEMLKMLENKFKEDITTLAQNVKKIQNINKTFEKISYEQKICINTMEVVSQRQERISRYLVDLNNRRFKQNLLDYNHNKTRRNIRSGSSKSKDKKKKSDLTCS